MRIASCAACRTSVRAGFLASEHCRAGQSTRADPFSAAAEHGERCPAAARVSWAVAAKASIHDRVPSRELVRRRDLLGAARARRGYVPQRTGGIRMSRTRDGVVGLCAITPLDYDAASLGKWAVSRVRGEQCVRVLQARRGRWLGPARSRCVPSKRARRRWQDSRSGSRHQRPPTLAIINVLARPQTNIRASRCKLREDVASTGRTVGDVKGMVSALGPVHAKRWFETR